MCYRILYNFVDIHHEDLFTLKNSIKTRGTSLKLLVTNSRVYAHAGFFIGTSYHGME